MPTPFYHLSLAEGLLDHPSLPETIRQFLHAYRAVFLFGNTAPDVQVVSGQLREETHFFSLPIQPGDIPAWELLLRQYPPLGEVQNSAESRAAFIAGYLCHLQADWLWVKELFSPTFGPTCSWSTFPQRLYLHNVLRAYLDMHLLPWLKPGMDGCLRGVIPENWLPFVQDRYLLEWRDFLAQQLQLGAVTQTVEVFASRMRRPAPEFRALLGSQVRMRNEVFTHLPLEQVCAYQQRALVKHIRLVSAYLAHLLHGSISSHEGRLFQGAQP